MRTRVVARTRKEQPFIRLTAVAALAGAYAAAILPVQALAAQAAQTINGDDEGAGLDQLVPDLWPMAIIASVTLSAAAWLFRGGLE